jgi:hypothetical protein
MKSRLYLLSSILWLALIWISTSLPADEIPNLRVIGLDKLAHWGVFSRVGSIGAQFRN